MTVDLTVGGEEDDVESVSDEDEELAADEAEEVDETGDEDDAGCMSAVGCVGKEKASVGACGGGSRWVM